MDEYYLKIRSEYQNAHNDHTSLFEEVRSIADEIGLDQALAYLEQCVIEKRLAWFEKALGTFKKTKQPVWGGFKLFYEAYLDLSIPEDGEIVEQSEKKIISRWWNSCPTLEVCNKLGLDTRVICKQAYAKPVQELLIKIDPKLRFDRNYACIRPKAPYCEEIIYLEE